MQQNSWINKGLAALSVIVIGIGASAPATAQSDYPAYSSTSDRSDVRLFRSWAADAVFTPGIDLEPVFTFGFYEPGELWFGGARVAAWVSESIEAGGQIGWGGFSPDDGESDSGFADLELFARYRVPVEFGGTLAAGTEVKLPTGSASAGQDRTFVRIFGALRQDIGGAATFTANLGFEYVELLDDDGTGLALGFGTLVPMTDNVTAVVELNLRTALDYTIVTGGIDYELPPGGHLRAAVGIGLDSQAPDLELQAALTLPVF